jgi:hypothetical protein
MRLLFIFGKLEILENRIFEYIEYYISKNFINLK